MKKEIVDHSHSSLGSITTGDRSPEIAESKHTPGPWRALSPAEWASDQWVIPGVAHCGKGELSEANARLIAAAPDMLEALKAVVAVADRKTVEFDKARAAIAKATGGA